MTTETTTATEEFKSSVPIQIRFNDIDALGHINNNVYLSYFDLGKTEYLGSMRSAVNWLEGAMVLAHIDMEFQKPVFYREEIEVDTKIVRLGDKSGNFVQQIRNAKTGEVKCVCKSVFVYFDAASQKGASIPHPWRQAISKHEGVEL